MDAHVSYRLWACDEDKRSFRSLHVAFLPDTSYFIWIFFISSFHTIRIFECTICPSTNKWRAFFLFRGHKITYPVASPLDLNVFFFSYDNVVVYFIYNRDTIWVRSVCGERSVFLVTRRLRQEGLFSGVENSSWKRSIVHSITTDFSESKC